MSTYPSIVATLTSPNPTDRLNAPSHSGIETAQNGEITAVETFVGTLSSVAGTLVYDIRSANSNGGGHIQSANKGGTGQIQFNKGDILVAQSSSVLTKLSLGSSNGQALVIDNTQATGVKWGVPNNQPTIRVFSVSGASSVFTWTKPSNLSYARITVQAPGGGGASVASNSQFSSGGGGGGFAVKILSASILGLVERIDVGGPGSVSGAVAGISSFGLTNPAASIMANSGQVSAVNALSTGGGTAIGGDINIQGGSGGGAGNVGATGVSGDGGGSQLGQGGKGGISTNNGSGAPAVGYGSGGPGAARDASGNSISAGPGAPGIVIVEEY